jgi:uncharacterized Ntn-hydrolase superfamily protein
MLRRLLLPLLVLATCVAPLSATWSIVVVNLRTREVGVVGATCLEDFNLRKGIAVIVVGEGAAAAQSFVDTSGDNRRLIYFDFKDASSTPAEILAALANLDAGHQTRQYGIVNFEGAPVSFTGTRDGLAATGVTGQIGDLVYAIQGNVLTGNGVVFAAEAAFRAKKGDMAEKMMAAMEAARALGGDGRCSCDPGRPTSCGVPPPSFTKSAHVACMVIARIGDVNGGCNAARGCAEGEYWLNLNVRGDAADPDPVFTLQSRYDQWKLRLRGRPDGLESRVGGLKALPADGVTERTVTIELVDREGRRIPHGGALVEVATIDGLPSLATVGPVLDLGNGRYTFTLKAGTVAGVDRFRVRATDVNPNDPADIVTATLYPYLEVETFATSLYTSVETLSAGAGGALDLVVNRADKPGAPYLFLARLVPSALTEPRLALPRGFGTLLISQSPFFPSAPLLLDTAGRGEAVLKALPGELAPFVARRVEFTGYVLDGAPLEATATVGVEIVP